MRWWRDRYIYPPSLHWAHFRELLTEIKAAKAAVTSRDQRTIERVNELEHGINEILLGMRQPGGNGFGADDRGLERKSAVQMCVDRYGWQHQKNEGRWVD